MSEREQRMDGGAPGERAAGEERLRTLLSAAYPASTPSQALRQRVAEQAAQHEAKEAKWRPVAAPSTVGRISRGPHAAWTRLRLVRAFRLAAAAALFLHCPAPRPRLDACE